MDCHSSLFMKLLIWSHDKIIMKFGQNKLVSLVLGKEFENCLKIKEKYYLMKLTSKSNINWKLLILFKYKIVMKFGPKKRASLVIGKVFENCPNIKENCYFTKHTSTRVISTRNHLFGSMIR